MSRRVRVLVVSIFLVETAVLGAGAGTTGPIADGTGTVDGTTDDSALDRATDRIRDIFPGASVAVGLSNGSECSTREDS